MYREGTMTWGSMYGPSGGESIAQRTSVSIDGGGMADRVPLGLAAFIAFGLLAWFALEKWD